MRCYLRTRHPLVPLLVLLFALLIPHRSSAQFSDTVNYYAGLNSTGTYNRTNSSRNFLLNNSLKFSARKNSLHYNLVNKWLYGEQNNKTSNNDYSSLLDVNLHKTFPHFNYWGLVNYSHSYSLKIVHQFQGGAGIAYNILDRKNLEINLSDGLIYDYSEIIRSDTTRSRYDTWRNSLRIRLKGNLQNKFSFNANGFYQPSIEYGNDYILRADVYLGIKIQKWLSFTVTFLYNEMSRTKAQNVFITYGLIIEKYF